MSVKVTLNSPGDMTVSPEHVQDGKTLVYANDDAQWQALVLWMTPDVAAQWIRALTPLAKSKP
jgi:hypothetical protein